MLATFTDILQQERRKRYPATTEPLLDTISFIKEGQRPDSQSTQDWEMRIDLAKKLQISLPTLRPDVELTVPWEEGCEERAEREKTKNHQLVQDSWDEGWTTWLLRVGVGCRGFPKARVRGHEKNSCLKVGGSSGKSLLLALA